MSLSSIGELLFGWKTSVALSIIFVIFAAYTYGKREGNKEGTAKAEHVITEYEKYKYEMATRLAEAQAKTNTVVETVYIDRVKTVKQKEYVYVKQASDDVPATFQLSVGWVYLHDQAAGGVDADPARSSDATPSGVQDNQGLGVVVTNYSECKVDRERLTALQKWVTESIANAKNIKHQEYQVK